MQVTFSGLVNGEDCSLCTSEINGVHTLSLQRIGLTSCTWSYVNPAENWDITMTISASPPYNIDVHLHMNDVPSCDRPNWVDGDSVWHRTDSSAWDCMDLDITLDSDDYLGWDDDPYVCDGTNATVRVETV